MIEGIAEYDQLATTEGRVHLLMQVEMSGRIKSWIYICILTSLVAVVKQTRILRCVCVCTYVIYTLTYIIKCIHHCKPISVSQWFRPEYVAYVYLVHVVCAHRI